MATTVAAQSIPRDANALWPGSDEDLRWRPGASLACHFARAIANKLSEVDPQVALCQPPSNTRVEGLAYMGPRRAKGAYRSPPPPGPSLHRSSVRSSKQRLTAPAGRRRARDGGGAGKGKWIMRKGKGGPSTSNSAAHQDQDFVEPEGLRVWRGRRWCWSASSAK